MKLIPKHQYGNVINFVRSYYNSPGFNQRFHNNIGKGYVGSQYDIEPAFPKKRVYKFPLKFNGFTRGKEYQYLPKTKTVSIGKNDLEYIGYDKKSAIAHELGHAMEHSLRFVSKSSAGDIYNGRYSTLYPVFRRNKQYQFFLNELVDPELQKWFNTNPSHYYRYSHDAQPSESYADLIALRYMLYNNGIYDSRKANNPFTKEHLNKIKETNPEFRLFQNFDDKDIIEMMNTVAYNQNNADYKNDMI